MTYRLNQPITIVDYDPRWPLWYAEAEKSLRVALAPLQVALEHIGSTAVPGLAAKPLLDISAALADREVISNYRDNLRLLGYEEVPINPRFERRLFCKGGYNEGTHHLHVTTYGSTVWAEPILLRDYLRFHPALATAYAQVKRDAAARHQNDLNGYHDQKSAFITMLMAQARSWQQAHKRSVNETMTIKIIGAGFGRTGTTSLKAALEQLGFVHCYHMQEVIKQPSHVSLWLAAMAGKPPDWDQLFTGYQATVDWPGCNFYTQLMAQYPDAKVLLTVRDPDQWYDSCFNTIYAIYRKPVMRLVRLLVPPLRRFMAMNERLIWQGNFAGRFADRDHALAVFAQHNAAVKAQVPPERLLVYDVKEGWAPLCRFLEVPIPTNRPFPHLNDRKTFQWIPRFAYGLVSLVGLAAIALLWLL